jgi:hypothetical protein
MVRKLTRRRNRELGIIPAIQTPALMSSPGSTGRQV